MAFRILAHALRMIFDNFVDAAKLTLVLSVVGQFAVEFAISRMDVTPGQSPEEFAGVPIEFVAAMVLQFVLSGWAAVVWHRYVLLQEYPKGWLPTVQPDLIFAYLVQIFLISLAMMVAAVPLALLLGLIVAAASGIGLVFGIAGVFVVLLWLSLRFSLVLPAVSVGGKMSLKESWSQTAHYSQDLFWLAGILALIGGTFGYLPLTGVLGMVLSVIFGWFSILLGASVLTTVYGVVVEGREIK